MAERVYGDIGPWHLRQARELDLLTYARRIAVKRAQEKPTDLSVELVRRY